MARTLQQARTAAQARAVLRALEAADMKQIFAEFKKGTFIDHVPTLGRYLQGQEECRRAHNAAHPQNRVQPYMLTMRAFINRVNARTSIFEFEPSEGALQEAEMEVTEAERAQCSICLGDCDPVVCQLTTTRCEHVFHKACLDKWLNKSDNCPVCRRTVVF